MGILDSLLAPRPQGSPRGGLDPRAGGTPGLTLQLKQLFDQYNISTMSAGETPMAWEDWLQTQGYGMGPDRLVRPLQEPSQLGGRRPY